jgi:hypothetical protein
LDAVGMVEMEEMEEVQEMEEIGLSSCPVRERRT